MTNFLLSSQSLQESYSYINHRLKDLMLFLAQKFLIFYYSLICKKISNEFYSIMKQRALGFT